MKTLKQLIWRIVISIVLMIITIICVYNYFGAIVAIISAVPIVIVIAYYVNNYLRCLSSKEEKISTLKMYKINNLMIFESNEFRKELPIIEDLYDDDVEYYPEHLKGDESMKELSIEKRIYLPEISMIVKKESEIEFKIDNRRKVMMEEIILEHNPDYYKSGYYHSSYAKTLKGFEVTASFGCYFAIKK